jgi:hypothetical protein
VKKNNLLLIITIIIIFLCLFFTLTHDNSNFLYAGSKSINNTSILIDVNAKTLYVACNKEIIKTYPVAVGLPDTPTPIGDFTIIQKDRWGEGFGSAWLGLNVPWGQYGIHGTTTPESIGYAASHGCIRMNNIDIDDLYKTVSIGTPVKIYGGIYGLFGNGFRYIIPGDRGADVLFVQKRLNELGFYTGAIDGIYSTELERAINRFQESEGLEITNIVDDSLYESLGIKLFE